MYMRDDLCAILRALHRRLQAAASLRIVLAWKHDTECVTGCNSTQTVGRTACMALLAKVPQRSDRWMS